KEKTSVLDTEVESILYSLKNEPSKSNTKNEKSQASNIEQEGKLAEKGKQKATSFTNMITEQEGPSTKVSEPNYSEKSDLIDNINNQDSASMESPNSTSMLNQDSLSIEANHKDTGDETSVTNLDQDVTMEPLDSDKENKTEEKEFTLVTSKKNN
ncbi:8982_t:CDS:2, partial [Cetraspora pellucida]